MLQASLASALNLPGASLTYAPIVVEGVAASPVAVPVAVSAAVPAVERPRRAAGGGRRGSGRRASGAGPAIAKPRSSGGGGGARGKRGSAAAGAVASASGLLPLRGDDHIDVVCDRCHMCPIRGVRFKCAMCVDHDICEGCHESTEAEARGRNVCGHPDPDSGAWQTGHLFLHITRPITSTPPALAAVIWSVDGAT